MKWFHQMTSWQTFVRKEHLPNKTTDAPSMDESLTVLGHGKLCWSIHKTLMIPGDDTRWFSCVLCRSFWSLQKWEHGIHLQIGIFHYFQLASLDCWTSPSVNLFYGIRASRYSRPPLLITVEPLGGFHFSQDGSNQSTWDEPWRGGNNPSGLQLFSQWWSVVVYFDYAYAMIPIGGHDISWYIMVCQYVALWGRWMFGLHD